MDRFRLAALASSTTFSLGVMAAIAVGVAGDQPTTTTTTMSRPVDLADADADSAVEQVPAQSRPVASGSHVPTLDAAESSTFDPVTTEATTPAATTDVAPVDAATSDPTPSPISWPAVGTSLPEELDALAPLLPADLVVPLVEALDGLDAATLTSFVTQVDALDPAQLEDLATQLAIALAAGDLDTVRALVTSSDLVAVLQSVIDAVIDGTDEFVPGVGDVVDDLLG